MYLRPFFIVSQEYHGSVLTQRREMNWLPSHNLIKLPSVSSHIALTYVLYFLTL